MPASPADSGDQPRAARRDIARTVIRLAVAAALGIGVLMGGMAAVRYIGAAVVDGAVRALVLLLDAGVWVTVALQEGVDWWSIAGRATATLGQALMTPSVMSGLIGLELLGAAAFYLLQRLLKDDERREDSSEETS